MLKWFLIPIGLLTALALAAPQLVIVGLIFGILPGLVLILIPTIFVYLLVTCLIGAALPLKTEISSHVAGFGLTLALSAAFMHLYRVPEVQRYEQALLPEVVPPEKITLAGHVFVDWPKIGYDRQSDVACDYLCTALLDTPGVFSVTRTSQVGSATFWRGPQQPGELVLPQDPQELLEKFGKLDREISRQLVINKNPLNPGLQQAWAMRIADGDELRRDQALPRERADWTITLEQQHERGQPSVDRLEIRDRQGVVLVRKSWVRHFVPAPMFYWNFEGGSSMDGFRGAQFTLGGSIVSNQPRLHDFDAGVELLRHTAVTRPAPPADLQARVEEKLCELLRDPDATPAQLLIVPMWLGQLRYNATPGDVEIIARVLLDERIADPVESLKTALSSSTDLTPLRAGLVKRYHNAQETKAKSWYINALVGLMDGTFAEPTADERAIWRDALDAPESAPFIERMADLGPAALPDLMALLDSALKVPWHARWRVLEGIREACKRLGPEAAPVMPRIQALIEASPRELLNTWDDRIDWLVTLRLMGASEAELRRAMPDRLQDRFPQDFRSIEQQAQRYRDERAKQNKQ